MNQEQPINNTPWAKLIGIQPDKQNIYLYPEYPIANSWSISQNQDRKIFIKNISALYLRVEETVLQINQEKELVAGERLCLNNKNKDFDYVFCVVNFQSDLKRDRDEVIESQSLQKLVKIEAGLQRELSCSICSNYLGESMNLSPCQHTFCGFCLFDHLKSSNLCPLCRTPATSVAKSPVLSSVIQLVEENFSILKNPQERKELEQISLNGVIMPYEEGVYIGSLVNGKKEGQGKFIYQDGEIYEGSWKNNKREGKGVYIYDNGDKYDGYWMNDKKHGTGKYTWSAGQEYEGDFQEDCFAGFGTIKNEDGKIYQGGWKNDEKEGPGVLTFPNGDKYEGKWVNGAIQREVKVEYSNGEKYEGEINVENFKKHGKGVFTFQNGDKFDGYWMNDKQHGQGREISRNGQRMVKGIWKDGGISGEVIMTDVDGKRYQAEWKRLEVEGEKDSWSENTEIGDSQTQDSDY